MDLIEKMFVSRVMSKIVKLFKLNIQLLNHQNNSQNYFITEASYYTFYKVSKTILFAIFGFIDLKVW